jgi:ABC-type multidrug transport system ATPase subunit
MNISFTNLALELKSIPGKKVLNGVTGELRAGRVTAVMGPSGAGKTTFLNAVSCRATYGITSGIVCVNGEQKPISHFKSIVGFVPQDDTMLRELTVKEILTFCAEIRLPADMPKHQKKSIVSDAIGVLGLWEVRHSYIGDEETRGISGGQRKRVNIGMELVSEPSVLFLVSAPHTFYTIDICTFPLRLFPRDLKLVHQDEPTSGLDSTSSMDVLAALREVSGLGLNIITVLHQPRYEIYEMVSYIRLYS